jgi:FdhD protein
MRRPAEPRSVLRLGSTVPSERREDLLAVEAPLTLSSQGDVWLTTMRTPGHDRELLVGWLYHEGLVEDPTDEISRLTVCGRPDDEGFGDAYDLVPNAKMEAHLQTRDPELLRRTQVTSCGLCGYRGLDELVRQVPTRRDEHAPAWPVTILRSLLSRGSEDQPLFLQTGAVHAASIFNANGETILTREDVGRHNAVDKVIGHLALERRLPVSSDLGLMVSSRASFEIVHKAARAGFSVVLSASAPTSLAVDLAERCGILLAGFFRGGGFNVYSGQQRVLEVSK